MTIKLATADILTAFDHKAVGSKVNPEDLHGFRIHLIEAVDNHDFSKDKVPGQSLLRMPDVVNKMVSCGVGRLTHDPSDYVTRLYRDNVCLLLKRRCAVETTDCSCVVYTRDAYLADPDVTLEESKRIEDHNPGYTHVVVAVLASGGPAPVVGPYRFLHNLSGGNHEYDLKAHVDRRLANEDDEVSAQTAWEEEFSTLVGIAEASKEYAKQWRVVAD